MLVRPLLNGFPQPFSRSIRNTLKIRNRVPSAARNVVKATRPSGTWKRSMEKSKSKKFDSTATHVGVLFFPQRIVLRIDGHKYSPAMLEAIVTTSGLCNSFPSSAKLLQKLLHLKISPKQANLLTTLVGNELQEARDVRTKAWRKRLLTEPKTVVDPLPQLACVQTDGGRMQTRTAGRGTGVHDPHWRETKNAGFFRMASESHQGDPHSELPSCFSTRKNMSKLLAGLDTDDDDHSLENEKPDFSWRPKPLFRSCLSSLCNSDQFGPMMAAEADRRGFFTATRRAFLADGLPYNWSIQRAHFPTFVPILDFIHSIERLHEVSRAIESNADVAWQQTIGWIRDCWQGNIEDVIGILKTKQIVIGEPPPDADEADQRKVLAEAIGYLTNNAQRMDYPSYRQQGLPISSCLIESQIKELNQRVKGTEKFWNDGPEGEAILQIKAALMSDEDRLDAHFQNRHGSPYDRTISI